MSMGFAENGGAQILHTEQSLKLRVEALRRRGGDFANEVGHPAFVARWEGLLRQKKFEDASNTLRPIEQRAQAADAERRRFDVLA